MPFSGNDLLWGLAAPLLLAAGLRFAIIWLARQFASTENSDTDSADAKSDSFARFSGLETSLPFAVGAAVGYYMLNLGPWVPEAHYEWLPLSIAIAVVSAVIAGMAGQSTSIRFVALLIVYAAVACGVGYLLMPSWEDLSPSYFPYLICWILGVTVVSTATDLSRESYRWPFAVVWIGTCLAVSAIVAISESLRFAQIAGLTLGASLGLVVIGLLLRRSLMGGAGLTITTYLAGILLIAHVNSWSDVPISCYWLPMAGPLSAAILGGLLPNRIPPWLRATLVILAAAIPSTIAVVLGLVATLSE